MDSPAVLENVKLHKNYKVFQPMPKCSDGETWRSYLTKINAEYSINGLDGYKRVPDDSVDYCFSFVVLEHIRKNIFMDTIKEMHRFMRSGGVGYHSVDFTDHMGGGKNQLRFTESVWEDEDHYKMDNYTNRIQCSEMCRMLKEVGFKDVKVKRTRVFKALPIKRKDITPDLGEISDEDLRTAMAVLFFHK